MRCIIKVMGLSLLSFLGVCTFADDLSIENEDIGVTYSQGSGVVTIAGKFGDASVHLADAGSSAVIKRSRDKVWGRGKSIEVVKSTGEVEKISVYPGLPFVLIQRTLINSGAADLTIKKLRPLKLELSVKGSALDDLRANGTFGLIDLAKRERGSYCYAAVADPDTRHGVVGAWLTTERGSGVVFVSKKDGKVVLDTQIDYGALHIPAGGKESLEVFAFGFFDDTRIGLEKFADAIAEINDIHLKPQPTVYCSWYHLYRNVTEKTFLSNVAAGEKLLAPFGLSVMQIDDGWQEGDKARGTPKKDFFHANGQFPHGMEPVALDVIKNKLVAGIWYMPFSGDADTKWFADKQELFVKAANGSVYNAEWGGNPLDMSNPAARKYTEELARTICRDWRYKYIKIDGLWNGSATAQKYINTEYNDDKIGESKLSDSSITHLQAYRMGLKAVRKGAGEDVYILGCNSPQNMRSFSGTFGLVDGMRIGPDNGVNYPGILRGPVFGGRFYFLHNRVWQNDPDPLYVRDVLPLNQARMLSSWVTISGQLCSSSELYAELSPERLDILKRCMPSHTLKPRPADYFNSPCPSVWLLNDDRGEVPHAVVGYFNWGDPKHYRGPKGDKGKDPAQAGKKRKKCPSDITVKSHVPEFDYELDWIGLDGKRSYVGYEYWTDEFIKPFDGKLKVTVPEIDCRVISLRPVHPGRAVVLSTSRHITQGVVDLAKECWSDKKQRLSGSSKVVANDPYELRIAAGLPGHVLSCSKVVLSRADTRAGVTAKIISQEGWKLRVLVTSPVSRTVRWSLLFVKK